MELQNAQGFFLSSYKSAETAFEYLKEAQQSELEMLQKLQNSQRRLLELQLQERRAEADLLPEAFRPIILR
nr:hypothetical protein HK105_001152 [Polyrhizophydium stewartii]